MAELRKETSLLITQRLARRSLYRTALFAKVLFCVDPIVWAQQQRFLEGPTGLDPRYKESSHAHQAKLRQKLKPNIRTGATNRELLFLQSTISIVELCSGRCWMPSLKKPGKLFRFRSGNPEFVDDASGQTNLIEKLLTNLLCKGFMIVDTFLACPACWVEVLASSSKSWEFRCNLFFF